MTFVRLIVIYIIVVLAVVAVFKRDAVMTALGFGDGSVAQTSMAAGEQPVNGARTSQPNTVPPAQAAQGAPPAQNAYAPRTEPAAPMQDAEPVDYTQQVESARQAYWSGDLAGAERALKAALAANPGNADLHGELGNLYYAQARFGEAAQQFRLAGEGLVRSGRANQAMALIPLLQGLNPNAAVELRSMISQQGQ